MFSLIKLMKKIPVELLSFTIDYMYGGFYPTHFLNGTSNTVYQYHILMIQKLDYNI